MLLIEEHAAKRVRDRIRPAEPQNRTGFYVENDGNGPRCHIWQVAAVLAGCDFEDADECVMTFARGQAPDGRVPEWITPDGSVGGLPENRTSHAVYLDTPTALVDAAWHVVRHHPEKLSFAEEIIPSLGLALQTLPRSRRTGLLDTSNDDSLKAVHWTDHSPTGHVAGRDELFPSLLFIRACNRLADLLQSVGGEGEADLWRDVAEQTAKRVRMICWDKSSGLFRSFSGTETLPDIWGSALAVCTNVATSGQLMTISRKLGEAHAEFTRHGFIRRHPLTPKPTSWANPDGNGYFGFAAGWMAMSLDFFDGNLADAFVAELAQAILDHDAPAAFTLNGAPQTPDDLPTLCHLLEGLHLLQARRAKRDASATTRIR